MSEDYKLCEKCIEIANNIFDNIDNIYENENIKNYIDNSENIINKYIELFPSLTYHQIISLYLSITIVFFYSNII